MAIRRVGKRKTRGSPRSHFICLIAGSSLLILISAWVLAASRLWSLSGTTANTTLLQEAPDQNSIELELELAADHRENVRIKLYSSEAPDATRYVNDLIDAAEFSKCSLYRGEPVPSYWGSLDYPDRYFDGGRWGPPYALVQGGLISSTPASVKPASAENHRPSIERGMVAWAGGKGGPHFFIALADHPEWGHGHTVWGRVLEKDMEIVDDLVVSRPLKTITPKQPPILSYFVNPIPFKLKRSR